MSDTAIGFACAGVAILCFGSNFVPIKRFETGDGVFFQWIVCTAVWLSGMVVNVAKGFPPFQPLAMLGGFLWCTDIGVSLCIVATFLYAFVRTDVNPLPTVRSRSIIEEEVLLDKRVGVNNPEEQGVSWVDKIPPMYRKIVGITLSVISGVFYGVNFNPPQYLMDHGHSPNGLDYVFSHFTGIFVTSTVYFLLYCLLQKNRPHVFPSAILPGILSGFLWAAADISWFVANAKLAMVVAFPIITTGPGVVASLWGIFAFGEIKGLRNFLILGSAFAVTFAGVILIALSRLK